MAKIDTYTSCESKGHKSARPEVLLSHVEGLVEGPKVLPRSWFPSTRLRVNQAHHECNIARLCLFIYGLCVKRTGIRLSVQEPEGAVLACPEVILREQATLAHFRTLGCREAGEQDRVRG